jgi:hypothetical protein
MVDEVGDDVVVAVVGTVVVVTVRDEQSTAGSSARFQACSR